MPLEVWKEIFDWSAVVLVGLTFVAGAGALITGKILSQRQAAQLRQFDKELTATKLELAKAELALRQNVGYTVTPRRIPLGSRDNDEAIRGAKFKELEKYAGTVALVMPIAGDNEARTLADDIAAALLKSHWKAGVVNIPANIPRGYVTNGVQVRTLVKLTSTGGSLPPPPMAQAVVDLLNLDLGPPRGPLGGVTWQPDVVFQGGNAIGLTRYGFTFSDDAVVITVGAKPAWEYFMTHNPTVVPTNK